MEMGNANGISTLTLEQLLSVLSCWKESSFLDCNTGQVNHTLVEDHLLKNIWAAQISFDGLKNKSKDINLSV